MSPLILALDQGTTSSRSILFDHQGNIVASAQREFPQILPYPGWVEHDPNDIWESQLWTAREAISRSGASVDQIAAIGVANQRETTLLWERTSGAPIANAIVWQSRVSAPICQKLIRDGHAELIQEKTGLVVDAYFSATKVKHLLDTVPGLRKRAERGEIAFGTVDSYLLWRLTNGRIHVTDVSNASRTMLFNIYQREWDSELLDLFEIPRELLPEVRTSSEVVGEIDSQWLGAEIPVAGIAGDQQAATFGQACFRPGSAKNTYGTGAFTLLNTGSSPQRSSNRLLTTIGWQIGDEITYCLEGSVFVCGAVVQWLRDGLGIIQSSQEVESLAGSVEDSGGVVLVPAFVGLGAPYWDADARGTIVGITRGTTAAHIARAAVDSMAFQTKDLIAAMERDANVPLKQLKVDGGAAINNDLLQFQADLLGVPVCRPQVFETTALGAAYLAGLAVGFWSSQEELESHWLLDREFTPQMSKSKADAAHAEWLRAVERSQQWVVT